MPAWPFHLALLPPSCVVSPFRLASSPRPTILLPRVWLATPVVATPTEPSRSPKWVWRTLLRSPIPFLATDVCSLSCARFPTRHHCVPSSTFLAWHRLCRTLSHTRALLRPSMATHTSSDLLPGVPFQPDTPLPAWVSLVAFRAATHEGSPLPISTHLAFVVLATPCLLGASVATAFVPSPPPSVFWSHVGSRCRPPKSLYLVSRILLGPPIR